MGRTAASPPLTDEGPGKGSPCPLSLSLSWGVVSWVSKLFPTRGSKLSQRRLPEAASIDSRPV